MIWRKICESFLKYKMSSIRVRLPQRKDSKSGGGVIINFLSEVFRHQSSTWKHSDWLLSGPRTLLLRKSAKWHVRWNVSRIRLLLSDYFTSIWGKSLLNKNVWTGVGPSKRTWKVIGWIFKSLDWKSLQSMMPSAQQLQKTIWNIF